MFYIKKQTEEISVKAELTGEAYTLCPDCGKEVEVDLAETVQISDFDFYGTTIYCDECAARLAK